MLMPLQPVTLTSMTLLSTQPDIMLACHRHDLWPLRLSALMKPQRCFKLWKPRRGSAWPPRRLNVSMHQSSRIRHQSITNLFDSWEAPQSATTTTIHIHRNSLAVIMISIIIMTTGHHFPCDRHANQEHWQSIIKAWKRPSGAELVEYNYMF